MAEEQRKKSAGSWAARIAKAVIGTIAALVLLPSALTLLSWNEKRAVDLVMTFAEGGEEVVPVLSDRIDPRNEGRLVHVAGNVTADGQPRDDLLGVAAGGLWLERRVEMFQWRQIQKSDVVQRVDGSGADTVTTFEYQTAWSDFGIDSTAFKEADRHHNPPMPLTSALFPADGGRIGAFALTPEQLVRFGDIEALPLTAADATRIRGKLGTIKLASVVDGAVVLSWNPQKPMVGDLRITYNRGLPAMGSLIAAQRGQGFLPYATGSGHLLQITAGGRVMPSAMIASAARASALAVWGVRLVGFVMLFIAFRATLFLVAAFIPKRVPRTPVACGFVALVPTVATSTAMMALAWLAFRPAVALAVVALGAVIIGGILFLWRERNVRTI